MEIRQGRVEASEHYFYGKGKGYLHFFTLHGRKVRYVSDKRLTVEEGNYLIAAGKASETIFHAYACRNLTTGETGHQGYSRSLALGLICVLILVGYCLGPGFHRSVLAGGMAFVVAFLAYHISLRYREARLIQQEGLEDYVV